ncbi:CHAT domain-containing protein (plasmid) [Nostoc sp. UHCC 0926]|uniref:nSTAND1 domain-containing NTPase n=1 Tax=Nostoc sp. UHCC 0926 TaxID=3025190 RepID=UPI002362DD40|nr:CHAT domain-containing protein [Nostoc sp. UHCC 0926]WDD36975.1 CHAT domain-containing protein [Nostoc sp. UHCC 0926]
MSKFVVLKLDGDLDEGVRITFSISTKNSNPHKEITAHLPPAPKLQTTINQWRSNYRSLPNDRRAIKAIKVTYDGSIAEKCLSCQNSAHELQKRLNNWLRSESFRLVREAWLKDLKQDDEVQVLIRTSNQHLWQIPWHLWDLVEEYPQTEVALSASDYEQPTRTKTPTYRDKVKILAILGNSTNIDVDIDRKLLHSLPDTDVTFLVEPQRHEINNQLWEKSWDILFFAGHSETNGDSGRIYINQNQSESLSIEDLKYSLRKALSNGLSLAIFNSCDGLGLAYQLQALHIPQIIVMREQVPDEAAQAFLTHFLVAFALSDKSLYQAAKEARLKLHGLEEKYPCASWLPVICQNTATVPTKYSDLGRRATEICPYRGLFSFREKDAQFFFGREDFTKQLVETVKQKSLVAVIGPSGSGKSSLVFAGLAKRLRDAGNWEIVHFRPAEKPLFNLATELVTTEIAQNESPLYRKNRLRCIKSLANDLRWENSLWYVINNFVRQNPNKQLLLVADQFEELYTLCCDSQERQAFLDRLLEAINECNNFTLVITLRADFLGQALSYRPFADALQYTDLKLGPMTDEELRAAIEKPAALLGVKVERGLVERILAAVNAEPGDLPLLEFALTQLWAKQQQAQLTHAAYDEIGGVEAALARYADEVYKALSKEEKERTQKIFIQLVHPGEGTEDIRRIATRTELGEENWDLIARLADVRLVVTGYDEKIDTETVEIIHETLIGSWGKLHLWMQLDRDFRRWQEQLRASMRTWENNLCDEGALLRGVPLAVAQDWQQKRLNELSSGERSFIGLSLELQERDFRKRKRRLQMTILGLAIGLVITLMFAGVAWWEWQNARLGEIKAIRASSEALLISEQNFDALIQSLKASRKLNEPLVNFPFHRLQEKAEIQRQFDILLREALYKVTERNQLEKHLDEVTDVSFSPNGQIIATASKDKTVKIWSLDGQEIITLKGHQDLVQGVSFSSTGKTIATASWDGTVKLWTSEGKLVTTLTGDHVRFYSVSFSPDEKTIASGDANGNIKLWTSEGKLITTFLGHDKRVLHLSFSPDGNTLATAGADGKVKLWSPSGQLLHTLPGDKNWVWRVNFSPDGKKIATASQDNTVKLWSIDGKEIKILRGHKNSVTSVSFSPDGKYIATGGADNIVILWSNSGEKLQTLRGHRDWIWSVSFSPEGKMLATASKDGTAKLWQIKGKKYQIHQRHSDPIYSLSFSPDGKTIATASLDKTVKLWEPSGELIKILESDGSQFTHVNFSPDSKNIITATTDGKIILWNPQGEKIKTFQGYDHHKSWIWQVSFSPDGRMLASAGHDGTVALWGLDGQLIKTINAHIKGKDDDGEGANSVSFSPDDNTIATAGWDKTVKLWTREGEPIKTIKGHFDGVHSVSFSPNGKMIVSSSQDKTAKLWTSEGKFIRDFKGHEAGVFRVRFSPDGKTIATASLDKTVKLWSLDAQELKTYKGHDEPVWSLNFNPNGHILASADAAGKSILWELDSKSEQLVVDGCNWVSDYLQNNPNVKSDRTLCNGITH